MYGRRYPVGRVRRMRGQGKIIDWIKKAAGFLKKHKLVSKGLSTLAPHTGKYSPFVSGAAGIASQLGLGKHRRMSYKGSGLRLAGSGRGYGRRGA